MEAQVENVKNAAKSAKTLQKLSQIVQKGAVQKMPTKLNNQYSCKTLHGWRPTFIASKKKTKYRGLAKIHTFISQFSSVYIIVTQPQQQISTDTIGVGLGQDFRCGVGLGQDF